MLPTHRQVATHHGCAIYQRLPGFEFTPVLLGKIASYVVRNAQGQFTVFAFMYPLLALEQDIDIEEDTLLATAVQTIEEAIDGMRLGGKRDVTFEFQGGQYVEVDRPAWWIPTAP